MLAINDILIKAVSWTLVHTVWQGFILAFLGGIIILITRKSSSRLRYNLLLGLLFSFLLGVGCTFMYEFQKESGEQVAAIALSMDQIETAWSSGNRNISDSFTTIAIHFLNVNSPIIVLLWFIVFCIRSFQVCANVGQVYRIRNYRNQPVSDYWKEKLLQLSQKIQLDKKVVLLESQLVKVPSVTGIFKPIILLPIGMLSQLPQDQIEAILLHELAHIRRKDYLVNLVQNFIEVVFFFNPGILWLSSIIKEERENCCDDIAVSVTQCKARFVHALVSFEEYNRRNNGLVMGFGGKKNHLLNRAKRIINNDTKSLNSIEKTLLSVAIFAVVMIKVVYSSSTLSNFGVPSARALTEMLSKKTIITKATDVATTATTNDLKKKEIAKLSIEEVKNQRISEKIETKKTTTESSEYCEVTTPEVGPATEAEAKRNEAIAEQQRVIMSRQDEELKRIKANQERAAQELKRVQLQKEARKQEICNTVTTYEKTTVTDQKKKEKERIVISALNALDAPEKVSDAIIIDLRNHKIISGKNNLSYSLSPTKLIVNGVIQPDTVHAEFKLKYLSQAQKNFTVSNNISICYNFDISSAVVSN